MTKTTKRITVSIIGLVVFILIMTWFFPFSFFSINQTYTYSPDPIVVGQYVSDLNEFKETMENDLEEMYSEKEMDVTIDRSQYIIPFFEQDWLISKESVKMSRAELENLMFDVKNTRYKLLDLVEQVDYTKEERQYLVDTIRSLLTLEEGLTNIKYNRFASRKDLSIQFHNLHVNYMNSFMMFSTFYNVYQDERFSAKEEK